MNGMRRFGLAAALAGSLTAGLQAASLAQFVIPTPDGPVVAPYPLVPTDVTGIGGSLGRAQNLRLQLQGPDRNTVPPSHGIIVARDPRYCFTGVWEPIIYGEAGVALLPAERTLSAVVTPTAIAPSTVAPVVVAPVVAVDPMLPRLERAFHGAGWVNASRAPLQAQLQATADANYAVCPGNEITLQNGALLIKTNRGQSVTVSTNLNGNVVSARLADGEYAMVSAFDGRFTVANLVDSGPNSCQVYLTDKCRGDYGMTPVRVGEVAEIYPNGCLAAESTLVAYTRLLRIPLTNGLTMETLRMAYPRALKRFNITRNIDDCDLRRIMKTAAAVSYIDREREWNGYTPYAP